MSRESIHILAIPFAKGKSGCMKNVLLIIVRDCNVGIGGAAGAMEEQVQCH